MPVKYDADPFTFDIIEASKHFSRSPSVATIEVVKDNRPSWEETYFEIAIVMSRRSKDPHTKVGACLVKDGCVIGVGYNGEPRNFEGKFDWGSSEKYNYVVHAEMNAISNACSMGVSCVDAEIYVTLSPCHDCMKLIAQHQIKAIYYIEEYRDVELAKKIAEACGIKFIKFKGAKK